MSFRCDNCKVAQPSGTRPIVRVVETRTKDYPERKRPDGSYDTGGSGTEIVREERLCEGCY